MASRKKVHTPRVDIAGMLSQTTPEDTGDYWVDDGGTVFIPRAASPQRAEYDRKYLLEVARVFLTNAPDKTFRAIEVPVSLARASNLPVNSNRHWMYRKIIRAGEPLSPIVVVRTKWDDYQVIDGNHRLAAAKDEKLKTLIALEIVPKSLRA